MQATTRRFTLTCALLLAAAAVHAQDVTFKTVMVMDGESTQAVDDNDSRRLKNELRNGLSVVLKNRPFVADETIETSKTLADGNQIRNSETHPRMRDREGRLRYNIKGLMQKDQTVIIDPVEEIGYLIRHQQKDVLRLHADTRLPPNPYAVETTELPWTREVKTALGVRELNGVKVYGIRTETTIRPGAFGNANELTETSEMWRSSELQLTISLQSSTARGGERKVRIDNIKTEDVPVSAFALPAGYKLRDLAAAK